MITRGARLDGLDGIFAKLVAPVIPPAQAADWVLDLLAKPDEAAERRVL